MSQVIEAFDVDPLIVQWINWIAITSLAAFVVTLAIIPLIMIYLPADYFNSTRETASFSKNPYLRIVLKLLKNMMGVTLVLVGMLLLVLPGQGLISIALGMSLMDFPGKQRLQLRVIRQPRVLHAVNSLRKRCGRDALRTGRE